MQKNTKLGLILAFVVPVFIMIIVFISRGIFPFGDETFLRTDMYHQYAPFFSEFRYKLATGGSLLYSWDIGMGINFSALYAYYLASPFNWLILLIPQAFVIEFMTYSIVLKIGLAGLSFSYYLRRHTRHAQVGIALFGILYALSGYMAAYSWNIMWLDCIILFPLICLGLERLVSRGNGFFYALTLGVSITSNYYISIMICLFLIIYFCVLVLLKRRKDIKSIAIMGLQFAGYSLLAGGISAMVLLPEIYALQHTASGDFNFPQTFEMYFSIIDMLARHMPFVEVEIGLDHWPNIFCGVAIYIFVLLYVLNTKIKLREKVAYIGILVFFLSSFSINVLNYIWHGFHYPNSLPARQSFIYIFLVLFICARAYDRRIGNTTKHIGIALLSAIAFIFLAQEIVPATEINFSVFYLSFIFVSAYAGIYYLYKKDSISVSVALLLAFSLVGIEAAVNTSITSVTTTSRSAYVADNADVRALVENIQDIDHDFYRFDKVDRKTKDDGAWMNFRTVSLFSSTADARLSKLFTTLGNEASTNAYSITGQTPLLDMLFAVKYGLYTGATQNPDIELIEVSGETYLYKNPYTLSLGFMVGENFEEDWILGLGTPIDVQNSLSDVYNTEYTFKQIDTIYGGKELSFFAPTTGLYYAYVTDPQIDTVSLSYDEGNRTKRFENLKRHYILELGTITEGDEVTLTSLDDRDIEAVVYQFDYEALSDLYTAMSKNQLELSSISDTRLEGSVQVDESGILFTSIPYDIGWEVYVDGQKVETKEMLDAFLCFSLSAGEHSILFQYRPEGFTLGMGITIVSFSMLIAIYVIRKVLERRYETLGS